jgi:thiamine pyrophosphate-dependent acetolactate synthase large subunit-like protein
MPPGTGRRTSTCSAAWGSPAPIALGVAIAQPERGVIALEGDGSILMALGCLATIGMIAPRNLTIVIMDNGLYQITGKQTAATAHAADIVAIARGAGIHNSHWIRDTEHFEELTSRRFDECGPVLLAAKIDDAPGVGQTVRDPPAHPPPLHARAWHRAQKRA